MNDYINHKTQRQGKKAMKITCGIIADYFIWFANDTGSFISNLKLQKLVYYAQAWFLAIYGKPLFEEDFEAWIHGPAIPSLYREYKKFAYRPIEKKVEKPGFDTKVSKYLEMLTERYFGLDAFTLELLAHNEDPWKEARKGLAPDQNCSQIITKEMMKRYYGARIKK